MTIKAKKNNWAVKNGTVCPVALMTYCDGCWFLKANTAANTAMQDETEREKVDKVSKLSKKNTRIGSERTKI